MDEQNPRHKPRKPVVSRTHRVLAVRRRISAAVGAMFVVAGAWWIVRIFNPVPPNRLLASAFSEQRTIALRFPDALHAPTSAVRGSAQRLGLSRPASLLEAEAVISRVLRSRPDDVAWLQAKGRADVLDWNYEAAIGTLERALDLSPDSASLLVDLASAHFERAEAEARPIDYGQAIELLGRALDRNPDDSVALFNRGLASERVHLHGQAVSDWQHCLRVDPRGGWADEARQRLRTLEQRLYQHQQFKAEPSGNPSAFLQLPTASSNGGYRPELYLFLAIKDWLPVAFPVDESVVNRSTQRDARLALDVLAAALFEKHHDRWMMDLLANSSSPVFALAACKLSEAVKAGAAGDPSRALQRAHEAAALFRSARCQAGALRADFEAVYALQRLAQGDGCARGAAKLMTALQPRSWIWCQAQANLELASCLSMTGNLGQAQIAADQAIEAAQSAGYGVLHLRGLGIRATLDTETASFAAAWARDQEGLDEYWADAYPSMRAYQFYDDMSVFAEEFALWRLAAAVAREAVTAMASTGNRSSEAIARFQLARMALMAGGEYEARREFSRAEELFAALPQSLAVQTYRMQGEIGMAQLGIMRGEDARSAARLLAIRPNLAAVANYPMTLEFYQAQAEVDRRRGNTADEEKSLRAVVAIAEHVMKSLENDRERLLWLRKADQSYRELVRNRCARRDFLSALELWEWYRGAALRLPERGVTGEPTYAGIDFGTIDAGPPLPALNDLSHALPELKQETTISYAELQGGVAVWVYDDRGMSGHWIATPDQTLQRTARRFAKRCADPASDIISLQADGRYLYQRLISPIAAQLKVKRTLVFELDGNLSRVPFQALIAPDGEYFGLGRSIAYSPGFSYLRPLRSPDLRRAGNAVVVGSPTLGANLAELFEPLPDATAEAEAVASMFPNTVLLTGRRATMDAVTRALPGANVFHFAGHSIARAGQVGLLLAADDAVGARPSEAAVLIPASTNPRILASCSLVVLSACSTEKLTDDALADVRSVPEALLRAGVPHVVASAWNVDSRATAAFMNSFYFTLLSTGSVTGSLRSAEMAVSRQPATAHPYYWAAFRAWGQL